MDSMSTIINISQEEFHLFHNIDRELYKILVFNLSRDPIESMQILALWLWLEKLGFRNVVNKVLSSPFAKISELANEGVTCLNYIFSNLTYSSFEEDDIPFIRSLMDKEISLQILNKNKDLAFHGVATMLQDVCVRALGDITLQVSTRNSSESVVENQKVMVTSSEDYECHNNSNNKPSNMKFDEIESAKSDTITISSTTGFTEVDDFDRLVFSVGNYVLVD